MKRLALCLAVALAPLMFPGAAHAQAKIRVAIWEFENNSQGHWWFSNQLGPAVRNHIDTAFSDDAELARKFSVVERDKLALVMKEQGLGSTGAVDPKTAANVGKLLGVKYIITGAIDSFSINNTRGGVGGIGGKLGGLSGNMVQAEAVVSLRVIDTTTAERIVAVNAEGEVKKGGAAYRGTGMSRDAEWGIASEAAEKAAKALVQKFVAGNYASRLSTGAATTIEAKVIKVEGDRAWINVGSSSGVKVGDSFMVFKAGEELIDPDTGAKLGSSEEKLGSAEVVDSQEKFAIVKMSSAQKSASGLILRKPSGS